ncbi:hypothetical protein [Occallatibacter riparius]|uniref:Uncharacterized protein n=1 Tax=Occallatibacter riparius TaxID=1002689 RepID=A0A9J7BW04_9BACT|nr:hypothetical protein [Occallatibacter riparius]UWZ85189.1 hypothetical protein MOP44_04415 [Occallatibacter riparius]
MIRRSAMRIRSSPTVRVPVRIMPGRFVSILLASETWAHAIVLDWRCLVVWLAEKRAFVFPFGAPDQRTVFTPERVAIEKLDGTVIAERQTKGLVHRP